ncbi:MAG: glutathione S-transferase [Gammaproteobacteria bacterium RBG_16_51_14]|nr:MAG: glutathione S-transferase [Gammaproteobacteria bacterium RBG_16_51_14]
MKLYHFPHSPNSRRVLAVAFHLGIELELETIALPTGAHMQPDFVKLNPNHKIPTLVDGDFVLWESTAIMHYLVSKKPGTSLWSDEPRVQADIYRWLYWNIAHWSPACGIFVYEYVVKQFRNLGGPDPEELTKGEELFHRFAQVLEDHLKRRQWLVGDHVTLADYATGSFLDMAEPAHIPVAGYGEINRWYGNIMNLDAWKKSAPANFL